LPRKNRATNNSNSHMKPLADAEKLTGRMALFCAAVAGISGLFSLAFWLGGQFTADQVFRKVIVMAPSTAWGIVLLSSALCWHVLRPDKRAARIFGMTIALLVFLFSFFVLFAWCFGHKFSLEHWIYLWLNACQGEGCRQMSPITAAMFLVVTVSFWLVLHIKESRRPLRQMAFGLALAVFFGGLVVVLGFVIGGSLLFTTCRAPLALLTAVAFVFHGSALALTAKAPDWLLHLFGSEPSVSSAVTRQRAWQIVAAGGVLIVVIGIGGVVVVRRVINESHARIKKHLLDVAEMKANHIAAWYAERMADAQQIRDSTVFAASVSQYLADPSPVHREQVWSWICALQQNGRYSRVLLLDAERSVRLVVPQDDDWLGPLALAKAKEALATGQIVVSDLHLSVVKTNFPNMDLFVPLVSRGQKPIGVIMLEIPAHEFLYPLARTWPMPSETTESLLIRRDGDEIVYLNDLRHHPDAALKLRRSSHQTQLIAAQALRYGRGIAEGVDYRGVPVVGAYWSVPGTSWHMVAKMDQAEVNAPLYRQMWLVLINIVVFGIVSALGLRLLWEHHHAALLKHQLDLEHEKGAIAQRLRELLQHANDIIVIAEEDGRILEMNRRAIETYGYTADEFHAMRTVELRAPWERTAWPELDAKLRHDGSALFETVHQRKDGTTFPVEVSLRLAQIGDKRYRLAIIRDLTERKRAEQTLRESEQRFRSVFENSLVGIYRTTPDGRVLLANPTFVRMLGFQSFEDFAKQNLNDEGFHPEYPRQRFKELMERDGKVVDFESHWICPDGAVVYAIESAVAVRDATGQILYYDGVVEDITKRKQAEQALRESEQRFRIMLEEAADGVILHDAQGRIIEVNRSTCQLLGYTREELLSLSVHQVDPDAVAVGKHLLWERVFVGEQFTFESQYLRKDGTRVPVEERISSLQLPSGLAVLSIARDISERKRVEADLKRLATAVSQAAETVVVTDLNGTIQYVNPAFERMTGYRAVEAIGQNPRILRSGQHNQQFYQTLWETILRGETWRGRFINRRKDGSLYKEEAVISPVRDEAGQITNFVAVKHDITERERAMDALRETNEKLDHALSELKRAQSKLIEQERLRIVGQMASGIAHDFNNALAPILGFSELLLERSELRRNEEKLLDTLHLIFAAAQDAANVVRQLRELYRGRSGQTDFSLVNLAHVVRQAVKLTEPRWREETAAIGVRVNINLDLQSVPETAGNESALREAVMNLILNAVDAMPQGGTISLKTYADQQGICLEVNDTGEGMSEEVRNHCFDPFFTTKGIRGSGLGLAMVHAIVHNHGGEINVASELGKGSTFTIRLPIQSVPSKSPEPDKTDTFTRRLRILLVDDEQVVRCVYAEYLKAEGHQVEEAESGPAGLAVFARQPFDLVITDMAMVGMSGEQFATRIQELNPGTPIILLTGFGDLMKARGEKPSSVSVVLGKPTTLADLRNAIREAMGDS